MQSGIRNFFESMGSYNDVIYGAVRIRLRPKESVHGGGTCCDAGMEPSHCVVPSGEVITCSFGGRLDFDQFGLYRSIHKFSLFLYVSEKRFPIYTRILFLAYVVNI